MGLGVKLLLTTRHFPRRTHGDALSRERRHRDTSYGLTKRVVRFRSLEHDVEIGLTAEQQNGDEGDAERRKDLNGGAGNLWFGYCVVHMFTYGRYGYLTIDRCRSAHGWRVGYHNDDRHRPDPTRD